MERQSPSVGAEKKSEGQRRRILISYTKRDGEAVKIAKKKIHYETIGDNSILLTSV